MNEEDKKPASDQLQDPANQAEASDSEQPLSPVLKGLKYGAYTGTILGIVYVNMNTLPSLGFYDGSVILVCATLATFGAVLGAVIAWLSGQAPNQE
jgi:hypothetical protein